MLQAGRIVGLLESAVDYDVLIAGGSFAGLAAAAQLRGKRVLLVEPRGIGTVRTSACGTLLAVLEATGTMDSLLQVHDHCDLHLPAQTFEYPTPYPFCTFDYRAMCNLLLAQADVEILHASVLGHRGHLVETTRGTFDAEILIDASGWRAALAASSRQEVRSHQGLSFGLETVVPVPVSGLHFYYDPDRLLPFGIGWLFPTGGSSRAGVGSYLGYTRLSRALAEFLDTEFSGSPDGLHGGYFPFRRQSPTSGPVFRVGDAAGQCLPLTGEGIRPALYFGAALGRFVRGVLAGEMTEPGALKAYRQFVERHAHSARILLAAQYGLPRLPMAGIETIARGLERPGWMDALLRAYWRAFNPAVLGQLWSGEVLRRPQRSGFHVDSIASHSIEYR